MNRRHFFIFPPRKEMQLKKHDICKIYKKNVKNLLLVLNLQNIHGVSQIAIA